MARELVGHDQAWGFLRELAERQRLPHAMLFTGVAGVGKRMVAHSLAKQLLCHGHDEASLVEKGPLFDCGNHPDYHVLSPDEGKKDISIDAVRELIENVRLKPVSGTRSVAVIDEAHRLSQAASNAFLMTLEDPPAHCLLILVTEHNGSVLPTIRSRCQPVHFGLLSQAEMQRVLMHLCAARPLADDVMLHILKLCDGSLAPLELGQFVDPRTLVVTDPSALEEHLQTIAATVAELTVLVHKAVDEAISDRPEQTIIANAAADLASRKVPRSLLWRTILSEIRSALRTTPRQITAQTLLDALNAEYLVRERNAQLDIQLTGALCGSRNVVP